MKAAQDFAAAQVRKAPWYSTAYAYAGTVLLAVGLPFVCPKLPEPARPVCEFVHDVAHELVRGSGHVSSATSPATPSPAARATDDAGCVETWADGAVTLTGCALEAAVPELDGG